MSDPHTCYPFIMRYNVHMHKFKTLNGHHPLPSSMCLQPDSGACRRTPQVTPACRVVRGRARHGSKTNRFLGNGDVLELSAEGT